MLIQVSGIVGLCLRGGFRAKQTECSLVAAVRVLKRQFLCSETARKSDE